jgi:predicted PurR-regulated permease PerM
MTQTLYRIVKQQKPVWAWALIVSMFLVLVGNALALPVIAGCALAVVVTTLRSVLQNKPRPTAVGGGR